MIQSRSETAFEYRKVARVLVTLRFTTVPQVAEVLAHAAWRVARAAARARLVSRVAGMVFNGWWL